MFRMIAVVLLTIPLSGCWLLLLDSGDSGGYSTDDTYGQVEGTGFNATRTFAHEAIPARDGIESLKFGDDLVQADGAPLTESVTRAPYSAPNTSSANMAP